jgi:PDZ domain-containing secreted protein
MHELIHLYQDYNFRRKNADINANAHRYGYSNVIDSSLTETGLIKTISTMLYYLYDIERGAFIGEMNASVNAVNGITFDNIEHAIGYLKNTEVYKNYSQCFANCRHLANTESIDNDTKRLILSKVNSMLGVKFNTYNQFVKWLCQKSFKALEKLDNIIPKIACEKMNISTQFAGHEIHIVDDIRNTMAKK